MIKVSTQARDQVMQMMQSDGYDISDSFVRVGVKSGGCSGLSYELNFDNALGEDDKLFEDNDCLLYTSPSPRDRTRSRMPSSA